MTSTYEEFQAAKKLLNIDDLTTFSEIKKQYHKLIQETHPDKKPKDNDSHKKTVELMKAYEIVTKYCQNYTFCLSAEEFQKQNNGSSYDENSIKYNNWWKENYGKENLF